MSKIVVRGGNRLVGEIQVSGAKNAVLPILAASMLAEEGTSTIKGTPALADVMTLRSVIESLGVAISYENEIMRIDAGGLDVSEAPYESVRKMRASFLVMGPLLARLGHARIPQPGGCAIGTRPIDQHLKGFEAMGVQISTSQGAIDAKIRGKLQGALIQLDMPSVGATENLMMAASLAEGVTVIRNAAREPEIEDLAEYLNAMGAKITGAGTSEIRIMGVERLRGAEHKVIADRVEAGTYMIAGAITGGDIVVRGARADHLMPVIHKMREMGVSIEEADGGLRVTANRPIFGVNIKTLPHPGFPTDMQAQMMALMMAANGTSVITETLFENRFMHVDEFMRMNGRVRVQGHTAVIQGASELVGARVTATDLRAGSALILAGLAARGETEVYGLHHIDRGYIDIAGKLAGIGADIARYETDELDERSPERAPERVKQLGIYNVSSSAISASLA